MAKKRNDGKVMEWSGMKRVILCAYSYRLSNGETGEKVATLGFFLWPFTQRVGALCCFPPPSLFPPFFLV